MSSLSKLSECGQSYWLDNLSRKKIQSGELKQRIQDGLRGLTSNPAIFSKAISKSNDYDVQIKNLAKQGKNTAQIYEKLVIEDIQNACDLFYPIYSETNGLDGYVSLEVSPYLAHKTNETQQEARRLFKEVNRPNCFIKIPGTEEGIFAIEQMLYEGININITLLFSVKMYERVANAYITALERRLKENQPINTISSVASFFLSRIDVLVDQLLQHHITNHDEISQTAKNLQGTIAIANAKMAYQSFKKIFEGERWHALEKKGAKVQRPLWASTSTKNPNYSDVMYIEPIIGRHTVNTMPDETIEAFKNHGKVICQTVEKDLEKAKRDLSTLKKMGIDLDFVTTQLVNEGIQKFIDPYEILLKSIEEKSRQ
jgi:transaldolase